MSLESWVFLCRIAVVCGSVLAIVATFGIQHFQSKLDKTKDQKIDSLVKSNSQLERDLIGQGTYQEDLAPRDGGTQVDHTGFAFNGNRLGGPTEGITGGEELLVYLELRRLYREGRSAQIVDLATRQIAKTPTWLTPHLYRGAAHANRGDLEKAAVDLRYVVSFASSNPAYARASDLLADVERKLKPH